MERRYSGMTVNERLYVSGMLDKFDKAVAEKDATTVQNILEQLEVDPSSIQKILISYGLG